MSNPSTDADRQGAGWRHPLWQSIARATTKSLLTGALVAGVGLGASLPGASAQVSSDGDLMVIAHYAEDAATGARKITTGYGVGWLLADKHGSLVRLAVTGKSESGRLEEQSEYLQVNRDLGARLEESWTSGEPVRFDRVGARARKMRLSESSGWWSPRRVARTFALDPTPRSLVADPGAGRFVYHLESLSAVGKRVDHYLAVTIKGDAEPSLEWYVEARQLAMGDLLAPTEEVDRRWAVNPSEGSMGRLTPVDEGVGYRMVPTELSETARLEAPRDPGLNRLRPAP